MQAFSHDGGAYSIGMGLSRWGQSSGGQRPTARSRDSHILASHALLQLAMLQGKRFLSPSSLRGLFERRKQEETKFAIKSQVSSLESHQHSDAVKDRRLSVSGRLPKFFLKHISTRCDARRVAIIGLGNVGLYIAALFLKDGYSVI